MVKQVYTFGGGVRHDDARARDKTIVGGKGANLAEMASIGLPVPPGFSITTEICVKYLAEGAHFDDALRADVAEASRAPDGSTWVLLRSKSWRGIDQRVAPLVRTHRGYHIGQGFPVPNAAFDNFEGMAIEARRDGGWRFWLISDDGHWVMARTLIVALDYVPPARHDKSPATGAGPSK